MGLRAAAPAVFLLAVGFPQELPDARTLLKETQAVLPKHKTYSIEQRIVIDMRGPTIARMDFSAQMSASAPGRMRTETSGPAGGALIVSDGENTWVYVAPLKQYTKTAAATGPEAVIKALVPAMGEVFSQLKVKDPYVSARVAGEESVQVSGNETHCYVVEATLGKMSLPAAMTMTEAALKLWIDKTSKFTVKMAMTATLEGGGMAVPMQMNMTTTVTSWKFDEPLPDSLFTFTPPDGATEIPEFKMPGLPPADLTGKAAADFSLKGIDAKQYRLSDMRGKVVLADFWATWCEPCRRDLPMFERLHQEFRSKGLMVLGFDVGEDQTTIAKFLSSNKLNYPMLLTEGTDTTQNYSVTAYPTVVLIDREGKIAFYHVGAGSEKELRESLAKLGFESNPAKPKPE